MSHLRLTGRLAWRELRARPWRTLLVALFVALPVAGMVAFDVGVRSYPPDHRTADFGRAELLTYENPVDFTRGNGPSFDGVLAGNHVVRVDRTHWWVGSGQRGGSAAVWAGSLTDATAAGITHVVAGRLPVRAGEAALSPSLRRSLHVDIGDVVELRHVDGPLRVVGEAVDPMDYRGSLLVMGTLPPQLVNETVSRQLLIDVPGHPSLHELRSVVARMEAADLGGAAIFQEQGAPELGSRQVAVNWGYVVGALFLLVAGIVIAAAFAMGARRQLRTLGLLAASGAPPSTLRDVLLVEGAMSGAVGVVLGGVVAVVLLVLAAPRRDWILNRVADGWSVRPLDLVPIALLGIVASLLASVQPARAAGRIGVLGALAGQAPQRRVPRWVAPTGVVSFTGGTLLLVLATAAAGTTSSTGLTVVAVLGGVGVVLGTTALAPSIVARLEPVAGRLRGTWRLAARSLARSRARSSAVVAALAASAALALVVSAGALSADAWNAEDARAGLPSDVVRLSADRPITPEEVALVTAQLDHPARVDYVAPGLQANTDLRRKVFGTFITRPGDVAIGTPALARFLHLDERARAAIRAGRPLVLGEADGPTARVTVVGGSRPQVVDAVVAELPDDVGVLPRIFLPRPVVDELGVPASGARQVTLLRSASPVDGGRLWNAVNASDLDQTDPVAITWGSEPDPIAAPVQAGAIGVALTFAVIVLAVGLGLSAAESKAERDVLVAVGAGPRSTRGLAGAKAVVLAVVGGVLAVPTALVPAYVVVRSYDRPIPFRVPWATVGFIVVALPVLAGALTWACSAIAGRVRPVRASTFALD